MSSNPPPDCTLQFLGTATMILRLGPFTLLTDPNFLHRGQRAYLGYGLSSVRRTEPALHVDELPPLSAVLLSHMHGDHWDRVARRALDRTLPIVTTPKAARALHRQGFGEAAGLSTWDSTELVDGHSRLTVTALPGRHATGMARRLRRLRGVQVAVERLRDRSGRCRARIHRAGRQPWRHPRSAPRHRAARPMSRFSLW